MCISGLIVKQKKPLGTSNSGGMPAILVVGAVPESDSATERYKASSGNASKNFVGGGARILLGGVPEFF